MLTDEQIKEIANVAEWLSPGKVLIDFARAIEAAVRAECEAEMRRLSWIRDRIHDGSLQMTEDARAEALRLAREACARILRPPTCPPTFTFNQEQLERLIALARQSHMDALEKRGLVMVPKEATQAMLNALSGHPMLAVTQKAYAAMLAAATEGDSNA